MTQGVTEIKIDTRTLPKESKLIKWQTYSDANENVWKEGYYDDDNKVFATKAAGNDSVIVDCVFTVLHWKCALCEGSGYVKNFAVKKGVSKKVCFECR